MTHRLAPCFFVCAVLASAGAGCSHGGSNADSTNQDIVNGIAATNYPEAATIDFQKDGKPFLCSATIIAPRVVLTAGHCVSGADSWFVHAGGLSSSAATATVFDYTDRSAQINKTQHDIGLVFLDDPITLPRYPTIASSPLPDGSTVFNVGRILNNTIAGGLFGQSSVVHDGSPRGAPLDYASTEVIQLGDSGGPDFAFGTHTIVAVNSGTIPGEEFLARVDLVHDFIEQQVAAHGGGGAESPIPDATLRSVDAYEVLGTTLNCRSGPGTAQPIEQRLFQGQVVLATETPSRPRVALASDGAPWILIQPPSGGACYVSANFQFIAPKPDAAPPPPASHPHPEISLPLSRGIYGSLALVVTDGVLTGAVREGACEFTVIGPTSNANPISLDLLTSGGKGLAQIVVVNSTTLSFSTKFLPSTCIGVFDPVQLASGITQVLRASIPPDVIAFRTVDATQAFFHDRPNSPPRSSFVVRGQTVQQIGLATGGFALATSTNPQGVSTQGFLAEDDLVALGSFGGKL